ncbi:unnamed protein product [Thelazia callipaeda]|uniref:G_PROTEIN_RECEP_F1_2 domain-containing protein n=1 Tax=Thelazia callipaeda TaxID=103827 RepID=A0A0N5CM67_THECL|nr:unnamed protein product [Thelazia callipaeda]
MSTWSIIILLVPLPATLAELLREKLTELVRTEYRNNVGKKIQTEAEKVTLCGAIMQMYFMSYGIPLLSISAILVTGDTILYGQSVKFCFPYPTLYSKIFTYAIYVPLLIWIILVVGNVIVILRLFSKAKRLSVHQFSQHYADSTVLTENGSCIGNAVRPSALNTDENPTAGKLLLILLLAVLYSLNCYEASLSIDQSKSLEDSFTTPKSYFIAFLNILLASIIFRVYTLETFRQVIRKIRQQVSRNAVGSRFSVPSDGIVNISKKCSNTMTSLLDNELFCRQL